ncbi:hypothetical protein SUGI_0468050 [Cryptomeria japonica]|uniref:uncharacterized protein LOC131076602 n=1 Tax=Cryptomeria japonica TaxID=3369 RepID=UPI0024089D0D|nr:uncharacterized protein LOC131076602 [Cryptomeria japonica]GLJ24499.1 hypothetical protein SUGI_0468050 [Cryptomeria japonica]
MAYQCASGKECLWWVEKYLKDCVCGVKDYVSVGLGLIGLLSWAVAEVPQILTNFKNGSTEGVSLGFIMTWVVGNSFNLIGCWLEPATLPTQLYTAVLYTTMTLILACQIIYYDHFSKWWKMKKGTIQYQIQAKEVLKYEQTNNKKAEYVNVPQSTNNLLETSKTNTPISSLPISTASSQQMANTGRELFYTSARSLSSSHTPTPGSYLLRSRGSVRSGQGYMSNQSSVEEGLLSNLVSPSSRKSNTILRSVASTILFVGGINYLQLPTYNNITSFSYSSLSENRSAILIIGRKLLQGTEGSPFGLQENSSSPLGTWLGWLMAAIYMGARFPQISLNIRRGTVQGLNPLMFIFALIGNTTYVGSILVRTLDWKLLKPNMPWLVDAAVCVLLDFFIMAQFAFYKLKSIKNYEDGDLLP